MFAPIQPGNIENLTDSVKYLCPRFPFLTTEAEVRKWVAERVATYPRPSFQEVTIQLERKLTALQAADFAPSVHPAVLSSELQAIKASLRSTDALNHYLAQLKALFPAVPPSHLRTLLEKFDCQHVRLSVEALLQTPPPSGPPCTMALAPCDRFRSPEYRKAAKATLLNEFPMLWEYQIRAVLAERNYDFAEAHAQCDTINLLRSKGWFDWYARKQKKVPVVLEFERDLAAVQISQDEAYARQLNREEYEQEGQLLECCCCCDEVEVERVCTCLAGHTLCHECVRKRVTEQTYSTEPLKPLVCFTCDEPCDLPLRPKLLQRAVGPELWAAYSCRLAEAELQAAGIPVSTCPFCRCPTLVPPKRPIWEGIKVDWVMIGVEVTCCVFFWIRWPFLLYTTLFFCALPSLLEGGIFALCRDIVSHWVKGRLQHFSDSALRCSNPDCHMLYCSKCLKDAHPGHCTDRVHPPTEDGLRTFVEEAMARVTMRVCPDCGLHFQKESGCNKMTCPCGATMCYLCRASLKDVGYGHFCQHPRTIPGTSCTKCDRCELFREPDLSEEAKQAARQAKVDFLRLHPHLKVKPLKIGTLTV